MNCTDLKQQLEDYMDQALDPAVAHGLRAHVTGCDACQQVLAKERVLRQLLREYGDLTMASPDATFFDRSLIVAARDGRKQQHRRSWMTGFGSAMAAGLALWVVSSFWFSAPGPAPVESAVPTITMALLQEKTVNLVFSSASELQNATLTVLLPEGVEIAGYEGQRKITWMTDLSKGKNVLPLRLIGTLPTDGELLATLRHGEDDKTFRLRVDVS